MKRHRQNGVAAIEFAIILPLLVLLLFGTVEFGLLLYNQQVITNASREGARAGIVSQSPRLPDAQISAIVTNYCGGNLITFGAPTTANSVITRTGSTFQSDLTVDVTYNYSFLVLGSFGFGPINLTARTVMKME